MWRVLETATPPPIINLPGAKQSSAWLYILINIIRVRTYGDRWYVTPVVGRGGTFDPRRNSVSHLFSLIYIKRKKKNCHYCKSYMFHKSFLRHKRSHYVLLSRRRFPSLNTLGAARAGRGSIFDISLAGNSSYVFLNNFFKSDFPRWSRAVYRFRYTSHGLSFSCKYIHWFRYIVLQTQCIIFVYYNII